MLLSSCSKHLILHLHFSKAEAGAFSAGQQGCIQTAPDPEALKAALFFGSHSSSDLALPAALAICCHLAICSCPPSPPNFQQQHKVHDYMLSYFLKGDFLGRLPSLLPSLYTCTSQGSKLLPKIRVTAYPVTLPWPNILYTVPIIKFLPSNGELLKEKSLDLTQTHCKTFHRSLFCSTLLSTIQNTILPFM